MIHSKLGVHVNVVVASEVKHVAAVVALIE